MATIQGAIAIALLLWATLGRFGTPQPAPPPLSAGRQGLLENIAKLVDITGHREVMIKRYVLETRRQDVGRQLHAPRGLSTAALIVWLQRVGAARGVTTDCGPLIQEAAMLGDNRICNGTPCTACKEIYGWKGGDLTGRFWYIRVIADGMRGGIRKALPLARTRSSIDADEPSGGRPHSARRRAGTAKTLITRAFAASLALQFGRIQVYARPDARRRAGHQLVQFPDQQLDPPRNRSSPSRCSPTN